VFYGDFKDGKKQKFEEALKLMQEIFGNNVFAADNIITFQRSADFRNDRKLQTAVENNAKTIQERSILWRIHTLLWAAEHALNFPGDFVECGVWHGYSFAVITEYLDFADIDKQLYLYDTYEGIPEEYNSENRSNRVYNKENKDNRDAIYNGVIERFKKFPNINIVRGMVPDTFKDACPDRISLLHIDMNSTASELAALEALFDRVVPGGMIVFDDYGWSSYKAQKTAEDAFMKERGYKILEIPTGQGLVIKR
jgi:hypothetical protein